jgi:hypothetical protein
LSLSSKELRVVLIPLIEASVVSLNVPTSLLKSSILVVTSTESDSTASVALPVASAIFWSRSAETDFN